MSLIDLLDDDVLPSSQDPSAAHDAAADPFAAFDLEPVLLVDHQRHGVIGDARSPAAADLDDALGLGALPPAHADHPVHADHGAGPKPVSSQPEHPKSESFGGALAAEQASAEGIEEPLELPMATDLQVTDAPALRPAAEEEDVGDEEQPGSWGAAAVHGEVKEEESERHELQEEPPGSWGAAAAHEEQDEQAEDKADHNVNDCAAPSQPLPPPAPPESDPADLGGFASLQSEPAARAPFPAAVPRQDSPTSLASSSPFEDQPQLQPVSHFDNKSDIPGRFDAAQPEPIAEVAPEPSLPATTSEEQPKQQQPLPQPASQFDDDDDDFGDFADFDEAPAGDMFPFPTPSESPAFPAAPPAFPLPPAPVIPAPPPATPAAPAVSEGPDLLRLPPDQLNAAVASAWSAFSRDAQCAGPSASSLDDPIADQEQLERLRERLRPRDAQPGSILYHAGIPLATVGASGDNNSSSSTLRSSVYTPIITADTHLQWRGSASEQRMLSSLRLWELTQQVREAEEAEAAAARRPRTFVELTAGGPAPLDPGATRAQTESAPAS